MSNDAYKLYSIHLDDQVRVKYDGHEAIKRVRGWSTRSEGDKVVHYCLCGNFGADAVPLSQVVGRLRDGQEELVF